jgi:hypothetical protein
MVGISDGQTQQQAQPAPHPPPTGLDGPVGSVASPVVAKMGSNRAAPVCPCGQVAGASASAMGRRWS